MSPLRKLKAKLKIYKMFDNNLEFGDFYQFILDVEEIKRSMEGSFKL